MWLNCQEFVNCLNSSLMNCAPLSDIRVSHIPYLDIWTLNFCITVLDLVSESKSTSKILYSSQLLTSSFSHQAEKDLHLIFHTAYLEILLLALTHLHWSLCASGMWNNSKQNRLSVLSFIAKISYLKPSLVSLERPNDLYVTK